MTTNYPDFAISDQKPQLDPAGYASKYAKLAVLQPKTWRLTVPWANVATAPLPGPYSAKPSGAVTTVTARGSGIVGNPHTNASLTVAAAATGTGRVGGAPPAPNGRDWSAVDNAINEVRLRTGADVVLVIGQSMPSGWTNAQYQSFCAEVVQRYKPGGPGIRTDGEYASLTGWGCTDYEIWNEQNNQAFWTSPVSAKDYTALLIAGHAGVKSVLPGAASTVIFGGMQHVQFTGPWYNPFLGGGYGTIALDEYTFLLQCYSFGAQGHFDAMATHLYPAKDLVESGSNIGGVIMPGPVANGQAHQITATATGTGVVNLATPSRNGRLQVSAVASGTGRINQFQPPGPVPSLAMDNFRQLQAIYGLMVANGDAALPVHITELGYCVYTTGMTPALQKTYVQACFDLLSTLPYVKSIFIYNGVDWSNGTTDDGYTGYGVLDTDGNPRPLYDWLRTLTPLVGTGGTGGSVITATATGSGSIGGQGAMVVTATSQGSGAISPSGGIITATATGTGGVGAVASAVITATATGTGVRSRAGGGTRLVIVTAEGTGQVEAIPAPPAGQVGVVGIVGQGSLIVTEFATNAGPPPAGGALPVAAAALGTGAVGSSGSGAALVAVAGATGLGVVGKVGSGNAAVTASAATTATLGQNYTGSGAPVVAAAGAGDGVLALFGSGAAVVTETALGGGGGAVAGTGAATETATAVGAGVLNKAGAGTSSVTATATGSGVVGLQTGGAATIAASTSTVAYLGDFDSGSLLVTSAGAGAGLVGAVGGGSLAASASAAGAGSAGIFTGGGSASVAATATGTGMLVNNFWTAAAPQLPGTGAAYNSIVANPGNAWQTLEGWVQIPLSDACTITSITAYVTNAPGSGNSWTFTLRDGAADTAAAMTISNTAQSATWSGTLSVAQLALVDMKTTGTGTPAASGLVYYVITYNCAGLFYLMPAVNLNASQISSANQYLVPFGGNPVIPTTTATTLEGLVAANVTATKVAALNTVNGAANGSGAAGNTDTFTVVNNTTAATSAFSAVITSGITKAVSGAGAGLAFSPGDRMVIKDAKGASWLNVATCITVVPTVPGEQIMPFGSLNAPSTSATQFEHPQGTGANGWNNTESVVQFRCPACTIKALYANVVTAPGSGKSRTFKVRSNNADTTVAATIADTATAANDTAHTASHTAGNFMAIESIPTSTPAATSGVKLGFVVVPT